MDAQPHQFELNDDQIQIQEMARKFTADAITPFAAEWDEKHIFPRDTIREAAELGFGAIYVSEESGGIGLGRIEAALIMEAMAYGCPSTSAFISIHNMASWMIDRFGSEFGAYLSLEGTPYSGRAIPPQSLDNKTNPAGCNYSRYKVLQTFPVYSGPIAEGFGQPGFGIQYVLDASVFPGNPAGFNVGYLVANGYLARVTT